MLPRAEVDALTRSLVEALDLAQAGEVAEGHELLLWGLQRAEAVLDDGVLWGDELVGWWQWAITDYIARYGLYRHPGTRIVWFIRRHLTSVLAAVALFSLGLVLAQYSFPGAGRGWDESPNLRGARMAGAVLEGVDLAGIDLRGIVLRGAVLAGTSLRSADLTGADMTGADLSGARLDGATLRGARLGGANASEARGLRTADLTYAQYDAGTRWPVGFDPAARGAVLVPSQSGGLNPRSSQ